MEQRTSGVHAWLSSPRAYGSLQNLIGAPQSRRQFVDEHLRPRPGDRILDIGCGPGEIVDLLPEVDYVGIDLSPRYIEAARERHGDRGEFRCVDIREADFPPESFDLVSVMGLIHHLDDDGANDLFRLAARVLRDSGRLAAIEAVLRDGQPRIARWLIRMDRGAHVRDEPGYAALARRHFESVETIVREDMVRIPYSHILLECERPRRP
jgi:SAM-dependent methyltransferase